MPCSRPWGCSLPLLISLFVGLSVIIPYIGVTVMGFVMALAAFIQWGWSSQFASAMVAYAIIQILDGNLLAPLLLSGVVNLHPVAIVVAVLLFGGLWGLWGLFFAIPLATLTNAVIKAWFARLEQRSDKPVRPIQKRLPSGLLVLRLENSHLLSNGHHHFTIFIGRPGQRGTPCRKPIS